MQRLSASLRGLPVEVGIVDCALPQHKDFCYQDHQLPPPPHRPITKLWRAGFKNLTDEMEMGEMLYPPADLEPHLAFMIVEKTLRLALVDRISETAVQDDVRADFKQEEEDEDPPPSDGGFEQGGPSEFRGPRLQWEGEKVRRLPQPWNGGGATLDLLG